MSTGDDDLREMLLTHLKEAQIEMDQGKEPIKSIQELKLDIASLASQNGMTPSQIDELSKEFEDWRSRPLRKWRVVVKDIGNTEVGVVKARSKEEILAAVQCIGMVCAPVDNVEVKEIGADKEES